MQKNKKGFLKLLDRYLASRATGEEKDMMDIWYDSIEREPEESPSTQTDDEVKTQMWADIRSGMYGKAPVEPLTRRWWQWGYYRVAAASVILLAGFFLYRTLRPETSIISGIPDARISGMVKKANGSAKAEKVLLADGSQITLEPGAVLFYPKTFEADRRAVYLKGNGFFDIAKDPAKPFVVYTDDILTKVLGTSFTILNDPKKGTVEVAVASGKVLVDRVAHDNAGKSLLTNTGVVLTPNRKVVYHTDSENYTVGLVEKPRIIEKEEEYRKPEAFNFSRTPLSVVLAKLEKAYGVHITANDHVNDCVITADLSQDDLYGKLEIICAAVNAKFELKEDQIHVTGPGCNTNK
jgi:transmembrane sensor